MAARAWTMRATARSESLASRARRPPFHRGRNSGPLLDRRGREPGPEVGDGAQAAPLGHGHDLALAFLVGLRAPDRHAHAARLPGKVLDVEGDELGAAYGERHAEGQDRAVAERGEAVALNGPEQLQHDDDGGGLSVGRVLMRAADTGEHVGDDGATVRTVR